MNAPMSLWRHDVLKSLPQDIAGMIAMAAGRYGVSVEQIKGRARVRKVVEARQEVMYDAYSTGRYSYSQIGYRIGGRDHTTVMWGVRAHAKRNGLPILTSLKGGPGARGSAWAAE